MATDKLTLFTKLNTIFSETDAEIIADILYKNKLYDIVEVQVRNNSDWYDVDTYELSLQKNNKILVRIVDISKNIIL